MMYIELFHGRKEPEDQLDDWGDRGPVLGPFEYVHITYATDIKFSFLSPSDRNGSLSWFEDLVYYDGVYYGDFSVFPVETYRKSPEFQARHQEYQECNARPLQNVMALKCPCARDILLRQKDGNNYTALCKCGRLWRMNVEEVKNNESYHRQRDSQDSRAGNHG